MVGRYQVGEKPAWLLEIEEARATSSGAIGQSEAWAGNQWQQRQQPDQQPSQQDKQHDEQQDQQQEKQQEETEKQTYVAEEKEREEEVISGDREQTASEPAAATAALPEQLDDESMTSQQPAVSDVIPPRSQDPSDVIAVTSSQQHVIIEQTAVTAEPQYVTPPVSGCVDVTPSAEDFEICEKHDITTDDVTSHQSDDVIMTHQQPITPDHHNTAVSADVAQHHDAQQQQPRVCTELPAVSSSSSPSSSSSSAVTATVARQQATEASSSRPASTTVNLATDHGRGKRRHKDDKSKTTSEQSAEVNYYSINFDITLSVTCDIKRLRLQNHRKTAQEFKCERLVSNGKTAFKFSRYRCMT